MNKEISVTEPYDNNSVHDSQLGFPTQDGFYFFLLFARNGIPIGNPIHSKRKKDIYGWELNF